MCGHTRPDHIRKEITRVGVAPTKEKLVQHQLRWLGHIQWKTPEVPVHSEILEVMKILGGTGTTKVDM
jgi:hypothetical protein